MKHRIVLAGVLAVALAAPLRAAAEDADRITDQPAATLLLPYFEVALPSKAGGKAKGATTVFTVQNVSDDATLTRVTVWSDLAVPVTAFDVYLTGYDVQTIDLADVIAGRLPITASVGQDPGDDISPKGPASSDFNYASCGNTLPFPPELVDDFAEHMRAALTGQPSALFQNRCAGRNYGEKRPLARGFVTVDVVTQCSFLYPSSVGYFIAGGVGVAGNTNQLVGDYVFADGGRTHGDALVSVRADAVDFETSMPGEYTFYSRFVFDTAADNRQPLATSFAGRFVNDPKDRLFPGGTSVLAWRDPKVANPQPFDCASQPFWFPLSQEQIVVFDEEENPEIPTFPPVPPLPPEVLNPFPAATQRARVGGVEFPVDFERGWLFMNLNTTIAAAPTTPAEDPAAAQGFVTLVYEGKATRAAVRANQLDGAANAQHTVILLP
jgi:hypothetical protein